MKVVVVVVEKKALAKAAKAQLKKSAKVTEALGTKVNKNSSVMFEVYVGRHMRMPSITKITSKI